MLHCARTALQIWIQSPKAYASYSEWSEKKKIEDEKQYEENIINFEGAYLSDGWADSTQIGIGGALPRGSVYSKTS